MQQFVYKYTSKNIHQNNTTLIIVIIPSLPKHPTQQRDAVHTNTNYTHYYYTSITCVSYNIL